LAERGQGWQGSKTQAYWLVGRVLLTPPAEAAASQKWKIIYLQVLNIQDIKRFELPAEYAPALEAKPLVQHGGVNTAEVGVELRGSVVQIGEAGTWAYETGL